ncbi:helix-turn-helix domain-containing protein [Mucilaginibacter agri]|uniref:Helix-turn-helix domain-containing protein n=1 Tax=Mucilaginibacter agri TaxID=2695265 RepID=A0A966DVR3_9SPHI|nr:AraC family transcriptional regulator [Mucilaginibacter agri]NCD71741.1 helix-turn-helix domain-containing protein [Mucilaginibacter agri]
MKIQKEDVVIEPGHSFRIFSPSLRNYFYWHYHPEYELIYIEGLAGIRHVGQHISSFMESDLVLIGPNIPHLNFDYGLMTDYHQIVVQVKEHFFKDQSEPIAEFTGIQQLFKRATYGISFSGETKAKAAEMLKQIPKLDGFKRLLSLMEVFQLLSQSHEFEQLNQEDTSVKLYLNDKLRMGNIYNYIHQHYHETADVNAIADKVGLSTAAFCRYFKRQTAMTFTDFVNQYRINQAKTLLLQDNTVSETCYSVGFQSLSYFNKLFKQSTGQGPLEFKKAFLKRNNPA